MMIDFTPPPRPTRPLTSVRGWTEYAALPDAPAPPSLSREELFRLPVAERVAYDRWRNEHHANLGPFKTPQSMALRRQAGSILRSNLQDATRLRPCFSVDGASGTRKSTTIRLVARDLWRDEMALGPTRDGDLRVPVVRVSLKGTTTTRQIDEALARAYVGSTARRRRSAPALERFIEYALSSETKLVIFDDFNHVAGEGLDQILRMGNHLKGISEEVTATLVVVGAGVNALPFLNASGSQTGSYSSGTSRRWFPLEMSPMRADTARARRQWLQLLLTIDQRVVLAEHVSGTLPGAAQMLFDRTQGHMQSLLDVVNQACSEAIADGSERLTAAQLEAMPMTGGARAGFERRVGASASAQRRHQRERRRETAVNATA